MKILSLILALAVAACAASGEATQAGPTTYGYEVVRSYPHDKTAFTQGLLYLNGHLYESTGQPGQSSIRKVKVDTGEVVQKRGVPAPFFGEGIVNWKDRLIELTWQHQLGFVYDINSFEMKSQFTYRGEGWGLTQDGSRIIMSDGSTALRFLDPETLQETGRIHVSDQGRPVDRLNELEWVKGEIWANVWTTDRIARIDPATGAVVGWIDLSGLLNNVDRMGSSPDVLNGIAYDAQADRLFVTGKYWPKLYEIRLVEKPAEAR